MVLFVSLTLVFLFVLLVAYLNKISGKDAPYYPLDPTTVFGVLEMVKPTKLDILYDLGSGDGRILVASALKYSCKSVGVELNPFRFLYSSLWIKLFRISNKVTLLNNDFFDISLKSATIIIIYLLPETHTELKNKLLKELSPKSQVIAVAFPIKGWKPKSVNLNGCIHGPIYLYEIGNHT